MEKDHILIVIIRAAFNLIQKRIKNSTLITINRLMVTATRKIYKNLFIKQNRLELSFNRQQKETSKEKIHIKSKFWHVNKCNLMARMFKNLFLEPWIKILTEITKIANTIDNPKKQKKIMMTKKQAIKNNTNPTKVRETTLLRVNKNKDTKIYLLKNSKLNKIMNINLKISVNIHNRL
jgi:hypothetical protein